MNKAVTVFYVRNSAAAFSSGLIFTSLYAYYVREVGLSPFQLVLLGAMIMATGLLFELPTGVVADVLSRRLSIIIGGALVGVCYVLVGSIPLFAVALLACFIEALGETFVSGALEAWLTDEIVAGGGAIGDVVRVIVRSEQIGSPAHWAGIGASVVMATWLGLAAPVVAGGLLWLATTVLLIAIMPETAFAPQPRTGRRSLRAHLGAGVATFATGLRLVRATPVLLMLMLAQIFQGAFFEPFFRLYQAHMLTNLTLPVVQVPVIGALSDVVWFGLIDASVTLLYLPASEGLRRAVRMTQAGRVSRALLMLFAFVMAGALLFAWAGAFWLAVMFFLLLKVALLLTDPLLAAWRNQHITSDVRATVLSMTGQANSLGQLGGGLAIGALGNRYGMRAALSAAALCLAPLVVLIARWRAPMDTQDRRG